MKKIVPLLLASFLLSSCATIFNKRQYTQTFTSDDDMIVIVEADTLVFSEGQRSRTMELERSRYDQQITVIRDMSVDTIALHRRISPTFSLNILSVGAGYVVDLFSAKKWQYDNPINLSDPYLKEKQKYGIGRIAWKGLVNLRLSLPMLNTFNADNEGFGRKSELGSFGLSYGLDIFYSDKMFLNLSAGAIASGFIPVPLIDFLVGDYNHLFTFYGALSNNHLLFNNRFSAGYGLTIGHDIWGNWQSHEQIAQPGPEEPDRIREGRLNSNNFGLIFSAYFYARRSFFVGLIYRPTFLQWADGTRWKYRHSISLDFGWRIRLTKPE